MNGKHGEPLDELITRWSEAARVILNGDLRTYAELAKHSSEYLLMPPNGGDPRRGFDDSDEAAAWWAQTFRDGQADVEVFGAYGCITLALIQSTFIDRFVPTKETTR